MIRILGADSVLLQKTISELGENAPYMRCIHIALSAYQKKANEMEIIKLSKLADEIIAERMTYFLSAPDGDLFMIAPRLSQKIYMRFIDAVEHALQENNIKGISSLLELGKDRDTLLFIAAQKEGTPLAPEENEIAAPVQLLDFNEKETKIFDGIARSRQNRRTPNVLVVDDDILMRKIVQSTFLPQNINVDYVSSGQQAIERYRTTAPDIVLLDIGLPDISGYEVMERIMAMDAKSRIIMLTSSKEAEDVLYCLHKGAAGYVAKPFSKSTLLHHVGQSIPLEMGHA